MKRVLIISYYWPPSGGSGVQRWLKLSNYLHEYGYKPVIYTPSNPDVNSYDFSLLDGINPGTEIIKRRITEPYALYKMLKGGGRKSTIKANAIENSSGGLVNYIRGNCFIPDPRCWWIKPSVRFLKKWLATNDVDAIISTGPPHSMHLIARELHQVTNIPWVADFRDPWTRMFYFKHLQLSDRSARKHRTLELGVLKEANRVVVVSEQMRRDFVDDLKGVANQEADNKVMLIENGYDPADFAPALNQQLAAERENVETLAKGKFVVAHTGLLTNSANPSLFWKALGVLVTEDKDFADALQITLIGQTDQQAKEDLLRNHLEKFVLDLGYQPHPKAIALQERANVLLLPLRKEPEAKGILTGKLFEYLASGSPIVAFGYKGCELERILNSTQAGKLFEYQPDAESGNASYIDKIKAELEKIWSEYKKGNSIKIRNGVIEKYSRKSQAEQYAQLLDTLI